MDKCTCQSALLAFAIIALTAINSVYALKVEFFSETNYSDFIESIARKSDDDDKDCFDMGKPFAIKSVRTDKCLMLYDSQNCTRMKGRSYDESDYKANDFYSFRVDKSTPEFFQDAAYEEWGAVRRVQSFHVCSQKLGGGPTLDVDYYNQQLYNEEKGKLVRQWRGVCTCQNVPESIAGGKNDWVSINNHGNSMKLFSEKNCRGREEILPAGDNSKTRSVFSTSDAFDVKSFRPGELLDCMKLDAKIHKFHFKNGTADKKVKMEKIKLAVVGQIVNAGPSEISEEYTINENVTELVEFCIAEGYANMHSVGADASVETTSEVYVPLLGKSELGMKVAVDYQYTKEDTSANITSKVVATKELVKVTKRVAIPGCNECNVTGWVDLVKNFSVDYDSYSRITGTAAGKLLRAYEIKDYLPAEIEYIADIDEMTVEAVARGTMYAQFGVQIQFEVKCDPIPGSVCNSEINEPTTVTYEVPFVRVDQANLKSEYASASKIIGWPIDASGECSWATLSESFPGL